MKCWCMLRAARAQHSRGAQTSSYAREAQEHNQRLSATELQRRCTGDDGSECGFFAGMQQDGQRAYWQPRALSALAVTPTNAGQ